MNQRFGEGFRSIVKTITLLFAVLFLLAGCATTGGSGGSGLYYVDVTNNTGYTIYYLYVSPKSSDNWEEDVLGDDVLLNGSTQRVTLRGYSSPIFDVKLEDSEGNTYTWWGVDVSEYNIVASPSSRD